MSRTGIYVLFQANRSYIASNLCEKRQLPNSTCEGKCFLTKELKKESEREKQLPVSKRSAADIIVVAPAIAISIPWQEVKEKGKYKTYTSRPYSTVTLSIFHPPQPLT